MDLNFTEEQNILRKTTEGICTNYSNFKILREIEGTELGFSNDFWSQLIDLGLTGINIPEQYGGSNMGLLDIAIVFEETYFLNLRSLQLICNCVKPIQK